MTGAVLLTERAGCERCEADSIIACTCDDRIERMRFVSDGQHVVVPWCFGCDQARFFCACPQPDYAFRWSGQRCEASDVRSVADELVERSRRIL